jgi:hypothetical protein
MLPISVRSYKGQRLQDTPIAHFRRFMRVARTSRWQPPAAAADTATDCTIRFVEEIN